MGDSLLEGVIAYQNGDFDKARGHFNDALLQGASAHRARNYLDALQSALSEADLLADLFSSEENDEGALFSIELESVSAESEGEEPQPLQAADESADLAESTSEPTAILKPIPLELNEAGAEDAGEPNRAPDTNAKDLAAEDEDDEVEVHIPDEVARPDTSAESETQATSTGDQSSGGLSLVAQKRKKAVTGADDLKGLSAQLESCLKLDDFSGSYELSNRILAQDPENLRALDAKAKSEFVLMKMYRSKLGPLEQVPKVAVEANEMMWLDLDHRSGFVLSQIDGHSSYEELAQVAGMDNLESYRIFSELLDKEVIFIEDTP